MVDHVDPVAPTVIEEPPEAALGRLGVVDLADLLLYSLVERKVAAILIEPTTAGRHIVRYESGTSVRLLAQLEGAVADAVVARLTLLAGLDIARRDPQIGRLRARLRSDAGEERSAELLVAVRCGPQGLGAELRRIVGPDDELGTTIVDVHGEPLGGGQPPESENKYRIIAKIGHGGMGTVYRAEHVVLQKPVAIKVLHRGNSDDPALQARLILEARAACRARHRGIVDVTDFGRLPDGRAFIVMELIEGPTLAAYLRDGPIEPERALRFARQIAEALGAAADNGVVHRDLKPANIFVVDGGDQVKVGDFGVACVRDPESDSARGAEPAPDTSNPVIVGTAAYMSPEQARGEDVDVRSDIYSLGCILCEMINGRMPYKADHLLAMLVAHARQSIPPLEGIDGPLLEPLSRIVNRAMAKEPDERYRSVRELCDDLERAEVVTRRDGWRRWLPR